MRAKIAGNSGRGGFGCTARALSGERSGRFEKAEKAAENLKKSLQKGLLFQDLPAIIIKRDCDRYAMKREVAADTAGFSVEYVRF